MQNNLVVPRTGLEPARLSTLAPETSASTIPPPGQLPLSGKRGSNSRPQPWQGCALPTELFPRLIYASFCKLKFKISKRAENEARTRDPNLGKVVLYQLSYFRIAFRLTGAKVVLIFKHAKHFEFFLREKRIFFMKICHENAFCLKK